MANIENLKIGKKRGLTTDEARRIGQKGGKASGESRRRSREMREDIERLLSLPCTRDNINKVMESLGIEQTERNNQMAMTVALWLEAMKGNVQAYNTIRDTKGEKPINKNEITGKDGTPLQQTELTMKQAKEFYEMLNRKL